MGNVNFDALCRTLDIRNARKTIANYEAARADPDTDAETLEWIERDLPHQRKLLDEALSRGWWE